MKRSWLCAAMLIVSIFFNKLAVADPLQAREYSDFSYYTLALSWQTGACQHQYEINKKESRLCKKQRDSDDKRSFLIVNGLWPSLPVSIAASGVDEKRWIQFACFARPLPGKPKVSAGNMCNAPLIGISLEMASKLAEVMPASGGDFCLERYEYAKHGLCFGFNVNDYFATMVRLNNDVKKQALGRFLQQFYGKIVTRMQFDQMIKQTWGENAVRAITLNCQGTPPYLTEIQIALQADKINQPLHEASFTPLGHPGSCTGSFRLDALGY